MHARIPHAPPICHPYAVDRHHIPPQEAGGDAIRIRYNFDRTIGLSPPLSYQNLCLRGMDAPMSENLGASMVI
jgi:hypothetical protein